MILSTIETAARVQPLDMEKAEYRVVIIFLQGPESLNRIELIEFRKRANELPLSVIFVGMGMSPEDADIFRKVSTTGNVPLCKRNIFSFIDFTSLLISARKGDLQTELTKQLFTTLIRQVVEYRNHKGPPQEGNLGESMSEYFAKTKESLMSQL